MEYLGNKDILKLHKTAFLCSQKCSADTVLKSYDWAKQQREKGNCVICGNHSQIEKDVFEILLKGTQPLILILARGMKQQWKSSIKNAIFENRLLIISPFSKNVKRITKENASIRNKKILELADNTVIGYISPNGMLEKILSAQEYKII